MAKTYDIRINNLQRRVLIEALSRMPDKGVSRNATVAELEGMLRALEDQKGRELHDFTA